MEKLKFWIPEIKFHLGLNVLIAIFITVASYVHYPYGDIKTIFVYFSHFLLLQFSIFGFVYIFSLFDKVFKILFPVVFLLLVSISFWVYTQDITVNTGMIQVILEASLDVAIDVFSVRYVLYIIAALTCLFFWIKRFWRLKVGSIKSPLFLISIFAIITFFLLENYKKGILKRRLPYTVFFGFVDYLKTPNLKLKKVESNIVSKEKNIEIIFVLGETVRADHLSLNGYHRDTNPLLSKQNNLVSFNKVYTPLTSTAKSLPQILTNKSIRDKKDTELVSLFSVLKKANFATEWIGNQSLERSYKQIAYTNDSITIIDEFHSVLSFKKEKDLKLLEHFFIDDSLIKNKITTIHMIGSHWYYNSRIDARFQYFKPITSSKFVGSSTNEEIVNSYDNTILYLDNFLNELILKLKESSKKTILIYLSDHGETMGEDGKWLHAQGNKASKNPAMLVWFSNNFEKSYPLEVHKLKSKKLDSISTDFLFHSLLDISKIENYDYIKTKSIFN